MTGPVTAKDCMSATVVTFRDDADVLDAIHTLVDKRISGAPVVDAHGNLIGVLTERDCLKVTIESSYHATRAGRVRDYMSTGVAAVDADTEITELAQQFLDRPYRRYPVLADGRLVGIVSRRDVLRAVLRMHRGY